MRIQVLSLALLSGLGIWCCRELWCGSQMWLGSGVAVAVVWAGSGRSNLTLSLGTSICCRCGPNKRKRKKKNVLFTQSWGLLDWIISSLSSCLKPYDPVTWGMATACSGLFLFSRARILSRVVRICVLISYLEQGISRTCRQRSSPKFTAGLCSPLVWNFLCQCHTLGYFCVPSLIAFIIS